jgi:hypothetical protein
MDLTATDGVYWVFGVALLFRCWSSEPTGDIELGAPRISQFLAGRSRLTSSGIRVLVIARAHAAAETRGRMCPLSIVIDLTVRAALPFTAVPLPYS